MNQEQNQASESLPIPALRTIDPDKFPLLLATNHNGLAFLIEAMESAATKAIADPTTGMVEEQYLLDLISIVQKWKIFLSGIDKKDYRGKPADFCLMIGDQAMLIESLMRSQGFDRLLLIDLMNKLIEVRDSDNLTHRDIRLIGEMGLFVVSSGLIRNSVLCGNSFLLLTCLASYGFTIKKRRLMASLAVKLIDDALEPKKSEQLEF